MFLSTSVCNVVLGLGTTLLWQFVHQGEETNSVITVSKKKSTFTFSMNISRVLRESIAMIVCLIVLRCGMFGSPHTKPLTEEDRKACLISSD